MTVPVDYYMNRKYWIGVPVPDTEMPPGLRTTPAFRTWTYEEADLFLHHYVEPAVSSSSNTELLKRYYSAYIKNKEN